MRNPLQPSSLIEYIKNQEGLTDFEKEKNKIFTYFVNELFYKKNEEFPYDEAGKALHECKSLEDLFYWKLKYFEKEN